MYLRNLTASRPALHCGWGIGVFYRLWALTRRGISPSSLTSCVTFWLSSPRQNCACRAQNLP